MDEQRTGLAFFRPGTPRKARRANLAFCAVFIAITAGQAFYWLFANAVRPILFGLPFGMFFVTALVVLEFVALLLLYRFQQKQQDGID